MAQEQGDCRRIIGSARQRVRDGLRQLLRRSVREQCEDRRPFFGGLVRIGLPIVFQERAQLGGNTAVGQYLRRCRGAVFTPQQNQVMTRIQNSSVLPERAAVFGDDDVVHDDA